VEKKICVYPGSFDPITNGHMDIIRRASVLCDRLIVAVLNNSSKTSAFSVDERVTMIRRSVEGICGVEVDAFGGLLVDYARKVKASAVVRGLRSVTDFESEMQMALANKAMAPEIETIFLPTEAEYYFISSSVVKEVGRYGGEIEQWIPAPIVAEVKSRLYPQE